MRAPEHSAKQSGSSTDGTRHGRPPTMEETPLVGIHMDAIQQGPTKTVATPPRESRIPAMSLRHHTERRACRLHLLSAPHGQRGTLRHWRTHVGITRQAQIPGGRRRSGDRPGGGIFRLYFCTLFLIRFFFDIYLIFTVSQHARFYRTCHRLFYRARGMGD